MNPRRIWEFGRHQLAHEWWGNLGVSWPINDGIDGWTLCATRPVSVHVLSLSLLWLCDIMLRHFSCDWIWVTSQNHCLMPQSTAPTMGPNISMVEANLYHHSPPLTPVLVVHSSATLWGAPGGPLCKEFHPVSQQAWHLLSLVWEDSIIMLLWSSILSWISMRWSGMSIDV